MEDKQLLAHAKDYIDQMAEGINPLTGEKEPDGSCLGQARISRCLQYVSGVLEQILNDTYLPRSELPAPKPPKLPFTLTEEELHAVTPETKKISLTRLLDHIYSFGQTEHMKKIPYKQAVNWLIEQGVLQKQEDKILPTPFGEEIGVSWSDTAFYPGVYYAVSAQQWIIDRLPELLNHLAQAASKPRTAPDGTAGGKLPFSLTSEQLDEIPIIPGGVSISRFVSALNSHIDPDQVRRIKREQITDWLVKEGYLYIDDQGARPSLHPSEKGLANGIRWEKRSGPSGMYWGTVYYDDAQLLILRHLQEAGEDAAPASPESLPFPPQM
jgi:hypothetical protein